MERGPNTIVMRVPAIKSKVINPIQITAEQLLQDAEIHQEETFIRPPERIRDSQELQEQKFHKRKQFEDQIRRQRYVMSTWIQYAMWEQSMQEFRRARSIFERAIEVDYKNISLWLKYVQMEMRNQFLNHARNVFERAVDYLPRVDQFWYQYAYMEELIGNYNGARQIFQRWMEWKPDEKAWMAFLAFQKRLREPENCRQIMYRFMECIPQLKSYLKTARFEVKQGNIEAARKIYEKTLEDLGDEALKQEYFLEFIKFEIQNKETERVREVFKFGLKNIHKQKAKKLYQEYISFEKIHGNKDGIDDLVLAERRNVYKIQLAKNIHNYDAWFDLLNLEMSGGKSNSVRTRNTFQEAVQNIPLIEEKRYWRRFIYIWYNYAFWQEVDNENLEQSEQVYKRVVALVPHSQFTFSQLWVYYAQFFLRQNDLDKMRKVFGVALGKCANEQIFREYIEIELQLANIDRVRKLYERFVEVFPNNPIPWIKWAELQKSLGEIQRFRYILNLAIDNPNMNMPENIWRTFIDNEIELNNYQEVRKLYENMLTKTSHVKVWISYAQFEASIKQREKCRSIFNKVDASLKGTEDLKEERALLLESWLEIEKKFGEPQYLEKVQQFQPQKVQKQRKIKAEGQEENQDAEDLGLEEYYDYIFPDDIQAERNLKILEKAQNWKNQLAELKKEN